MNFYERIIEELNNRKEIVHCICPDCGYKTNMGYESSRSSYLEDPDILIYQTIKEKSTPLKRMKNE